MIIHNNNRTEEFVYAVDKWKVGTQPLTPKFIFNETDTKLQDKNLNLKILIE